MQVKNLSRKSKFLSGYARRFNQFRNSKLNRNFKQINGFNKELLTGFMPLASYSSSENKNRNIL
jgi:hypothetical protein